jgi:hypothetical protein
MGNLLLAPGVAGSQQTMVLLCHGRSAYGRSVRLSLHPASSDRPGPNQQPVGLGI